MINPRIYTFLKLCQLMNYRETAQALNMTQPAVTQHIHYLEEQYGCKLFRYDGRRLRKTETCSTFERYAQAMVYNDRQFTEALHSPAPLRLAIGATKSIGDYVMGGKIMELLGRDDVQLELIIDNTERLLDMLNNLELDILLVEGYIDKDRYAHRLIREEELVGICTPEHPFAGRELPLEDLLNEHILIREEGSGTRAVFESVLQNHGYSYCSFRKYSQISSFKLITQAVAQGLGISFVYRSVVQDDQRVASFRIKDCPITHEFNYVYLQHTDASRHLALLR